MDKCLLDRLVLLRTLIASSLFNSNVCHPCGVDPPGHVALTLEHAASAQGALTLETLLVELPAPSAFAPAIAPGSPSFVAPTVVVKRRNPATFAVMAV